MADSVGFWVVVEFQEQFAQGVDVAALEDVLTDAEDRVKAYVDASYWALAETGATPYRLFRRVIGELAFWYLSSRPGILKQTTSSRKAYADDVKTLEQKYSVNQSRLLAKTEAEILEQLDAYLPAPVEEETVDEEISDALTYFGTGRFVS